MKNFSLCQDYKSLSNDKERDNIIKNKKQMTKYKT